jgi:hypothetical protein
VGMALRVASEVSSVSEVLRGRKEGVWVLEGH